MSKLPDTPAIERRVDKTYYLKAAIGLILMIGGQFIPAPAPITQSGMALLGIFFGLIFLYTTLDVVWPNIFAILIFSIYLFNVYPNTTAGSGIEDLGMRIFGGEIPVMLIGIFLICYALEESGVLYRVSMWFITRKVAQRGPWVFTFMLWLSVFVIGLVMDCSPLSIIVIGIAHSVFKIFGFKRGDAWPKAVITGIVWISCVTYACTPIGHNVPILFTGMLAGITGVQVSLLEYIAVGVPVAIFLFAGIFLYFKFFVKPDVSLFKNADFSKVNDMAPGKMDIHEKCIAVISSAVLILMIAPGVFNVFAPDNAFSSTLLGLSGQGTWTIFAGIALMVLIRIDGKPLLDLSPGFKSLPWGLIFMIGSIVTVSFGMNQSTTGISTWVSNVLSPVFAGFSPLAVTIMICVACVILTNILNNVAIGAVFIAIAAPLITVTGVNVGVISIAVMICSQLGFTTAAAFPTIGLASGDEYCDVSYVLRHGIGATVISLIVCIPLIYPLANLVFG